MTQDPKQMKAGNKTDNSTAVQRKFGEINGDETDAETIATDDSHKLDKQKAKLLEGRFTDPSDEQKQYEIKVVTE